MKDLFVTLATIAFLAVFGPPLIIMALLGCFDTTDEDDGYGW